MEKKVKSLTQNESKHFLDKTECVNLKFPNYPVRSGKTQLDLAFVFRKSEGDLSSGALKTLFEESDFWT